MSSGRIVISACRVKEMIESAIPISSIDGFGPTASHIEMSRALSSIDDIMRHHFYDTKGRSPDERRKSVYYAYTSVRLALVSIMLVRPPSDIKPRLAEGNVYIHGADFFARTALFTDELLEHRKISAASGDFIDSSCILAIRGKL